MIMRLAEGPFLMQTPDFTFKHGGAGPHGFLLMEARLV